MTSSERYTHGHAESVLRSHRWRTVENSAGYVAGALVPGARVLDVGCGPGTITIDIATRVAPGSVVGLDPAASVLAGARVEAESQGVANVEFRVGDVYALEADDGAFDVVHAHQVLQHLADPVAALVEMRRVCAPDGVVAARDADYGGMRWYPNDPRLDAWLDLYRRVARANAGEPDAGRMLLAWARRAGYSAVEASASVWCFADPESRAWWGGLWADRVTGSDLGRQAVDGGYATPEVLDDMAAAWRQWAEDPDGWFVVVHGEVRARV